MNVERNLKRLLEKAFDAGWFSSLEYYEGKRPKYNDFDDFYKKEFKRLKLYKTLIEDN